MRVDTGSPVTVAQVAVPAAPASMTSLGKATPASTRTDDQVTLSPRARMLTAVAQMLAEAMGGDDASTPRLERMTKAVAAIAQTVQGGTSAQFLSVAIYGENNSVNINQTAQGEQSGSSLAVRVLGNGNTVNVDVARIGASTAGATVALRMEAKDSSTALAGSMSDGVDALLTVINHGFKADPLRSLNLHTYDGNDVVSFETAQT